MEDNYTIEDLIKISEYIKKDIDNEIIAKNMNYDKEYIDYMLNILDKEYNKKIFNDSLLYLSTGLIYGITFSVGIIVYIYKLVY